MREIKNWTNEQKAGYLVDTLLSGAPDDMVDAIQGWLIEDISEVEKDEKLQAVLDGFFEERLEPDERSQQLLQLIHARLGFDENKKKVVKARRRTLSQSIVFRVAAVTVPILILAGGGLLLLDYNARNTIVEQPSYVAEVIEEPVVEVESIVVSTVGEEPDIVILPDGSSVRLVENTELVFADNFLENRVVKLTGEAFFSVEKMDGEPFTVETEKLTVTVLGTEFNMRAYPSEKNTVVSLASGKVQVQDQSKKVVTLAPMEQLKYDKDTGSAEVEQFDTVLIDRWKSGEKELHDVMLREALRQTADFYGLKLDLRGVDLPADRLVNTTLFASSSPESVLNAIRFMSGKSFDFEIDGDTVRVKQE